TSLAPGPGLPLLRRTFLLLRKEILSQPSGRQDLHWQIPCLPLATSSIRFGTGVLSIAVLTLYSSTRPRWHPAGHLVFAHEKSGVRQPGCSGPGRPVRVTRLCPEVPPLRWLLARAERRRPKHAQSTRTLRHSRSDLCRYWLVSGLVQGSPGSRTRRASKFPCRRGRQKDWRRYP